MTLASQKSCVTSSNQGFLRSILFLSRVPGQQYRAPVPSILPICTRLLPLLHPAQLLARRLRGSPGLASLHVQLSSQPGAFLLQLLHNTVPGSGRSLGRCLQHSLVFHSFQDLVPAVPGLTGGPLQLCLCLQQVSSLGALSAGRKTTKQRSPHISRSRILGTNLCSFVHYDHRPKSSSYDFD